MNRYFFPSYEYGLVVEILDVSYVIDVAVDAVILQHFFPGFPAHALDSLRILQKIDDRF